MEQSQISFDFQSLKSHSLQGEFGPMNFRNACVDLISYNP